MTALRRHASGPLTSPTDWAREWRGQIGADALRLVAPVTEVAFFQPPLEPRSRQVHHSDLLLSDIDLTFTRALHAAKPVDDGTAEEAVFALIAGSWKISVVSPFESVLYHFLNVSFSLVLYAPMLAISIPMERVFDVVAWKARSFRSSV